MAEAKKAVAKKAVAKKRDAKEGGAKEYEAKKDGAKDRIVRAAILCIEREGLERASVRKIAEEAGVNVAAINYYFTSKDQLITQVRDYTMHQGLSQFITDLDASVGGGLPMREALPKLLDEFLADAVRWPRITYAHLRDLMVEQNYRAAVPREVNKFLEQLFERVTPATPKLDAAHRRIVLSQLWSNVLLLMLMPRLMAPFTRLDLASPANRRSYVEALLAPLFGG